MPLSIDWSTFVISVPQRYLTAIGGVFYELDVHQLKIDLGAILANITGICFPDAYVHQAPFVLSGITYDRFIEIIDPYTIEFEDGQYVINCTGANHNVADVKIPNQVSIIVNNSAGRTIITETEEEEEPEPGTPRPPPPPIEDPVAPFPVCTMYGDFFLPDGNPIYRMSLQAQRTYEYGDSTHTGGSIDGKVIYYTDDSGRVTLPLARDTRYAIRLSVKPDVRYYITVPDEDVADILDYIFPYITEIKMTTAAFTLGVGETAALKATAVFSDGSEEDVTSAVTFLSANEAVASVNGSTLTGVATGSTTVNVDSIDDDGLPSRSDILEDEFLRLPTPYTTGSASSVDVT